MMSVLPVNVDSHFPFYNFAPLAHWTTPVSSEMKRRDNCLFRFPHLN